MDKITTSLQCYLRKTNKSFQTLFNIEEIYRGDNGTSTCFHIKRDFGLNDIFVVEINIFPEDYIFYISVYLGDVYKKDCMERLCAIKQKWNRVGMFCTLQIKEELGVVEPETYCVLLNCRGVSDQNGLSNFLWGKYIDTITDEANSAWNLIDGIECIEQSHQTCYNLTDESDDDMPF